MVLKGLTASGGHEFDFPALGLRSANTFYTVGSDYYRKAIDTVRAELHDLPSETVDRVIKALQQDPVMEEASVRYFVRSSSGNVDVFLLADAAVYVGDHPR